MNKNGKHSKVTKATKNIDRGVYRLMLELLELDGDEGSLACKFAQNEIFTSATAYHTLEQIVGLDRTTHESLEYYA